MIVAVGSTNPTKLEPVQAVFSHYFGVKHGVVFALTLFLHPEVFTGC